MTQLRTVTMGLTERDARNAERLQLKLGTHNKAEAVSAALSITSGLSDLLEGNKELIIRNKRGDMEKVIIPGFTNND